MDVHERLDRGPELLTTIEVAEMLRVSPQLVRRLGATGKLERHKISGRTVRYPRDAVRALLKEETR